MQKKFIAFGLVMVMMFSLSACITNPPNPLGYFYSLEEAYEQGWIIKDDLKKIAYILRENSEHLYRNLDNLTARSSWYKDFVPTEKASESLDAETEERIKEAYTKELQKQTEYQGATAEDVSVYGYCGTYNGYIAVMITDIYHTYNGFMEWFIFDDLWGAMEFLSLNIMPENASALCLYVWKDGETEEFYDIETAWEQKLLSEYDMKNISYYQAENYGKNWSENFTPATKTPEVLSKKTEMKIRQTELDLMKIDWPESTIDETNIGHYLGTYNGYVVFARGSWFMCTERVIGDVFFAFSTIGYLYVWKENK